MVQRLMNKSLRLIGLRNHFSAGDEMYAVHYGCENLYDAKDRPAAISCIAYAAVGGSDIGTFSVNDAPADTDALESEKLLLQKYFDFLRHHPTALIVHWNMSKPDYGFSALESRYTFLFKSDPYVAERDRLHDLDDLIAFEHGEGFAPNPRLFSMAALNGLHKRDARSGKDEAPFSPTRITGQFVDR
jgi:hypothetical protein